MVAADLFLQGIHVFLQKTEGRQSLHKGGERRLRFRARGILPVGMGSSAAMDTATILANNQMPAELTPGFRTNRLRPFAERQAQ